MLSAGANYFVSVFDKRAVTVLSFLACFGFLVSFLPLSFDIQPRFHNLYFIPPKTGGKWYYLLETLMAKTYYDDLKLGRTATASEIKRQYRALAHEHHPDTPGGSDAAFMKVQTAYEVLSNLDKRTEYDKELAGAGGSVAAAKAASGSAKPTPPPTAGWSGAATRKRYPPPPMRPLAGFRWRLTFFQTLVAAMVAAIVILIIRVGSTWSGGLGPLATPMPSAAAVISTATPRPSATPVATPLPTPTPVVTDEVTPSPSPSATPVSTVSPVPSTTPILTPTPTPAFGH